MSNEQLYRKLGIPDDLEKQNLALAESRDRLVNLTYIANAAALMRRHQASRDAAEWQALGDAHSTTEWQQFERWMRDYGGDYEAPPGYSITVIRLNGAGSGEDDRVAPMEIEYWDPAKQRSKGQATGSPRTMFFAKWLHIDMDTAEAWFIDATKTWAVEVGPNDRSGMKEGVVLQLPLRTVSLTLPAV